MTRPNRRRRTTGPARPATSTGARKLTPGGKAAAQSHQLQKAVQRYALRAALAAALIGAAITLALNWNRSPVPLIGDLRAFGILIVLLNALFTLIMAVLILAAMLLLFLGVFNPAGVELVYFTIAVAWLILLTRSTELLVGDLAPGARRLP